MFSTRCDVCNAALYWSFTRGHMRVNTSPVFRYCSQGQRKPYRSSLRQIDLKELRAVAWSQVSSMDAELRRVYCLFRLVLHIFGDSDEGIMSSTDACKAKCEEDSQGRQYSFDVERRCRTCTDPRLGKATSNIESDWLPDRMVTFDQQMTPCGDEGWIF